MIKPSEMALDGTLTKKGSKIKFILYGSCQCHFLLPKEKDVRHSAHRNMVHRARLALMASQLIQQIGSISFNAFHSPMNAGQEVVSIATAVLT
jgi:hypothetical protein